MKNKYIKNKKMSRSCLSIGSTLLVLSFFAFLSGSIYINMAIVCLFLGLIFLAVFYISSNQNKKLIEQMKQKCPICQKDVEYTNQIKYFVDGKAVNIDDFEMNENLDKQKYFFEFYKCIDCEYCLIIISIYCYKNNKEIFKSKKNNVDFNYKGDY